MKKINFLLALILFSSNLLLAQTWDILDKSMAAFDQNDGASTNKAWGVVQGSSAGSSTTQQNGYVNITKTSTGQSAKWAWLRPVVALANFTSGLTYSIEIKARVNAIDKTLFPDGTYFEANQISLRLANKATTPIYLRYGDSETGSISTTSAGSNSYKINTSDWQIYLSYMSLNLRM